MDEETYQCAGFRTRPRFTFGFKSAIGSRLIRLVWYESSISPKAIFKPIRSARPKFRIFLI
ncbi:hypothetical protein IGI04_040562 [Brassica rapa subsp. trilocularis]|uniref:Uncharacterized protein n=1 Tax=Brassica rapa subsp. trilocularis TaxID=1813537 RepID=A0ABQ7KSA5_BRACM|nr:hypothetical protein IGI04_040562 [Brassica rapa subsp. trilocularis]